jgi:hypothetical protein
LAGSSNVLLCCSRLAESRLSLASRRLMPFCSSQVSQKLCQARVKRQYRQGDNLDGLPQQNGFCLISELRGVPDARWQAYDAQPLTALTSSIRLFVPPLLEAGYTLFVINHRNGPRFRYPADRGPFPRLDGACCRSRCPGTPDRDAAVL